ncbi:hypothetical protein [Priestia megaterium]|jgi:hypothetical protein|uniref:hypothetical protein n=1 Tax=Priestia megaterium TaxID=1404 RepID=UPI001C22A017|nr:hypothetical protein [Priestia megaterium]MBU8754876.1 hypothetical protein [Priestia megaterium]
MSSLPVNKIVERVTEKIYELEPSLLEKFGERGKERCYEDNRYHMKYLETTYKLDNLQIFTDYALWLNNLLTSRGMKTQHIIDNFKFIQEALFELDNYGDKQVQAYVTYLEEANHILKQQQL